MQHAGRIMIVGSHCGLSTRLMEILANEAVEAGVTIDTTVLVRGHTYQLRPLMALDDNIITAPASRIKKGKGPRDKWGKLK